MSREDLSDFLHAVEHSQSLRSKLQKCSDLEMLVNLAKTYGFSISSIDIQRDLEEDKVIEWFKKSEISPLKKF